MQTVRYQVVQQHLETYLALAGEDDWDGSRMPAYVEREFRHYLECGILAYGFARARTGSSSWPRRPVKFRNPCAFSPPLS
ncbi:MAG: hypothetical protein EA400_01560 [Chromatiaceae bacterium]|nr:MAG: hypothetical protein EA400_01560 [Chromatiaceae bacterium]